MQQSRKLHGPAAIYTERSIEVGVTYEKCVRSKAGLEIVVKRKFPVSVGKRTSASSSLHSVSQATYKIND